MANYLLLLVISAILLFIAIVATKKDYFSPAVLATAAYFVMSLFALLGTGTWNTVTDISLNTVLLIALADSSFLLGALFAARVFSKKIKKKESNNRDNIVTLFGNTKNIFNISVILLVILYAVLSVINIKGVSSMAGLNNGSLSDMMSVYRENTGIFVQKGIVFSPLLNSLLPKILITLDALFCVYSLTISIKKNNKTRIKPLEIIIMASILAVSFLTSGRSHFIKLILIYVTISYIVKYAIFKSKKVAKPLKTLKKLFITILVVCVFYFSLSFIGRDTKMDINSYTTFYYGAQVPSLDIYLKNKPEEYQYKSRTFDSIKGLQSKLGLLDETETTSFEFIQFGKNGGSNIYTSARRPFDDFGSVGVFITLMVFGLISTWLYGYAKRVEFGSISLFVFYNIAILDTVIDQVRDLSFYNRLIGVGILVYIAVSFIVPRLFVRINSNEES